MAFRGHRETFNDTYNGNFLSDVFLLAEYDDVLKQVVNLPQGTIKYLSPQIQNEIIDILGKNLEISLLKPVLESPFYSIIVDTTQDTAKVDQLSFTVRYVKIHNSSFAGENSKCKTEIKIVESFLGFCKVEGQSAEELTSQILNIISNFGLNIQKCRGQGYDGASTMSVIYSGVQTRIKEIEKNALYIHCAAHNLNLVINDAMSGVQEISNFFAILQEVYLFFGLSINRWNILTHITGESKVTLKKLNPPRWAGRVLSCIGLKMRFLDVIKALDKINFESLKKEERDQAFSLKKKIESFEFIVTLILVTKVLEITDIPSKQLQAIRQDLGQASKLLQNCLTKAVSLRDEFSNIISEGKEFCQKMKIENNSFSNKRNRKIKKHFDELSIDYRFNIPEEMFRINVFISVIDILIHQLTARFEGMAEINNFFSFLEHHTLIKLSDTEIIEKANNVQDKYKEDISAAFALQLVL